MSGSACAGPSQSIVIRSLSLLLMAAVPMMSQLASGVWPGDAMGEGGRLTALSASEAERVEASVRIVQDAMIAALVALGGLGMGVSGIILLVLGYAHRTATVCLKDVSITLLLAISTASVLGIHGTLAMPADPEPSVIFDPLRAVAHQGESK